MPQPDSAQNTRHVLTVGEFRRWTADERDDCPIRVVVYTETGTVIGAAERVGGSQISVGAVNVILDKSRG
jgi:hypothetical protein